MALPLRSQPAHTDNLRGTSEFSENSAQTIVLVALDGVRREDVFGGVERSLALEQGMGEAELLTAPELMPNLHELIAASGAALGAPDKAPGMRVSGPEPVSLPGYLELLSGRRDSKCVHNGCEHTRVPTLVDEFSAAAGPESVAVISSWEGILRAAASEPNAAIVSTGRTRGSNLDLLRFDAESAALLEAARAAGPGPGHGDFRRDRFTAEIALRYLRVVKPRFLFVGLGETDEYAHKDDYRGYLRALQFGDRVVGRIATLLAELVREGRRCTLFVTTDHGRSVDFIRHGGDAPESADVWMAAAGYGIAPEGLLAASEQRHLADVTSTIRAVAGLPPRGQGEVLRELMTPSFSRLASR